MIEEEETSFAATTHTVAHTPSNLGVGPTRMMAGSTLRLAQVTVSGDRAGEAADSRSARWRSSVASVVVVAVR